MKGGGLLIVVFVIVFVFLFICSLWGISAIVGGIRNAFSSKPEPEDISQARQSMQEQKAEPPIPTPLSPPIAAEKSATQAKSWQDDIDHSLEQLERIGQLRKEGILMEEEFVQFKQKLLQKIQRT